MSIEIRALLMDDYARRIALFCTEPHSSSEIVKHITPYKTTDPRYYERVVSDRLRKLEGIKAITYSEGKWKTTSIASDILKKYFGLR